MGSSLVRKRSRSMVAALAFFSFPLVATASTLSMVERDNNTLEVSIDDDRFHLVSVSNFGLEDNWWIDLIYVQAPGHSRTGLEGTGVIQWQEEESDKTNTLVLYNGQYYPDRVYLKLNLISDSPRAFGQVYGNGEVVGDLVNIALLDDKGQQYVVKLGAGFLDIADSVTIPEPNSAGLLGLGLASLWARRRQRG